MMAHHVTAALSAQGQHGAAWPLLIGIAVAFGVSLAAAWVAALSAPEGPAEPSSLDQWDNGLAHVAGPLCSALGCSAAPVAAPHGWAVCEDHLPHSALCQCQRCQDQWSASDLDVVA
jgi:hypothetical protein